MKTEDLVKKYKETHKEAKQGNKNVRTSIKIGGPVDK